MVPVRRFSVHKLIGWNPAGTYCACSNSTAETLEKGMKHGQPKITINRKESRFDVFTVKCFYC